MRAFTRLLINLVFLIGTAAVLGAVAISDAYKRASHDAKIAIPVVIVVVAFILACVVLGKVVPAKKKPARRPSSPYAAPAGRK